MANKLTSASLLNLVLQWSIKPHPGFNSRWDLGGQRDRWGFGHFRDSKLVDTHEWHDWGWIRTALEFV